MFRRGPAGDRRLRRPATGPHDRQLSAATLTIVPRHVLGGPGQTPPSAKLNIAGVGVGGQGGWDLEQVASENIVALCDVDWGYAVEHVQEVPNATKYKDFREMLDREKSLDAVVVGTPITPTHVDGGHQARQACVLRKTADADGLRGRRWPEQRGHKVATQMGNQAWRSRATA